jgi:4-carboxymuconolactone decarboxylase
MDEKERFDKGMKVRREVLGDAHVDRSLERATPFNRDFQELITRCAWGEIWTRPGLERSTRSLLTLVLMMALNREEEFRMHVHAAFRNGVTREEISEALLHAAIYCGLPAANAAFKWAEQEIDKIDSGETLP